MGKINVIEIRCSNPDCRKWFRSPFMFGDDQSFDTSTMIGNKAQCHHCGRLTESNKENMRVRGEEGGFVGKDTG